MEIKKIIFKKKRITDCIIIKKKKFFYILGNENPNETQDLNSELFAYRAKNLINSKWKKVSKFPIIFDPEIARNGGLLKIKNNHYRVYQVNRFGDYGNSISFQKINAYKNKLLLKKGKIKFDKEFRTHHLFSNNEFVVYDYS